MHRLTITLPDDLYAMARAHAVASRTSISKAIADLLRRGREAPGAEERPDHLSGVKLHPDTGFPRIELSPGTTLEDIQRALDDEDVRQLEVIGLTPEEIQRKLGS